MRIINTLADIALLERYKILPESLLKLAKEQFQVVYEYNQDDEKLCRGRWYAPL